MRHHIIIILLQHTLKNNCWRNAATSIVVRTMQIIAATLWLSVRSDSLNSVGRIYERSVQVQLDYVVIGPVSVSGEDCQLHPVGPEEEIVDKRDAKRMKNDVVLPIE